MNRLFAIIICLLSIRGYGQVRATFIMPYHLDITSNKTTNLVFPYAVKNVDRGSKDVLAQKVTGSANVLELKAAKDSFQETNVSVITADGRLYSFVVDYAAQPAELNIVIGKEEQIIQQVLLTSNARLLQETAEKVAGYKASIHAISDKHDKMHLYLKGLYVQDDVFYFQLQLTNKSNVSYDVDAIRFTILDKHKSKRTARQESPLPSFYSTAGIQGIKPHTGPVMVIALPKFTLQDGKYLSIHVMEKGGGRDIQLEIGNRQLLRARIPGN